MDQNWQNMIDLMQGHFEDGEAIYGMLQNSRPEDAHILICPAHVGDTIVVAALAKAYKAEHRCRTLIVVTQTVPEDCLRLFSGIDAIVPFEPEEMRALQFYIAAKGLWYENGICYAHWKGNIVLEYPTVRIRELPCKDPTFVGSRKELLHLSADAFITPPILPQEPEMLPKKEVLLLPAANSLDALPTELWEGIAKRLSDSGYTVYTNYNGLPCEAEIAGTISKSSSLKELAVSGKQYALCIGLRSGACDLLALAGANLSVLYAGPRGTDSLVLGDAELGAENIYELGRRDGISCFQFLAGREEELFDAICKQLPA